MSSDPIRLITSARKRVTNSERALREAIAVAFHDRTAGHTVEDIATAAGLTKQRVYQIVRDLDQERS